MGMPLIPGTQEAEAGRSLVYRWSSETAKVTRRSLVSRKKKKTRIKIATTKRPGNELGRWLH